MKLTLNCIHMLKVIIIYVELCSAESQREGCFARDFQNHVLKEMQLDQQRELFINYSLLHIQILVNDYLILFYLKQECYNLIS